MFIVCITIMNRSEIMNKFTPDNLIEYNYLLISSTTFQSLSTIDLFFWKKGVLIFCMKYNCLKYCATYILYYLPPHIFAKEQNIAISIVLLTKQFYQLRYFAKEIF